MKINLLSQEHIAETWHFFQEILSFQCQHGEAERGHQNYTKWNDQSHVFLTQSVLVGALCSLKINLLSLKFTSLNNSLPVSYVDFFSLFNNFLSSTSSTNKALEGSILRELNTFN